MRHFLIASLLAPLTSFAPAMGQDTVGTSP